MKLLIATSNRHKIEEIRAILSLPGIALVAPAYVVVSAEVEEDLPTFAGNAAKKAVTLAQRSGLWAIADDSGLEVEALNGDPGVRSARYAGEPFVRVLGEGKPAEVRHVRGSNFCDIGWVMDKRTNNLIIVSAIDNLIGGTAGMAVQCMNVMFGLDERTGLNLAGMMP